MASGKFELYKDKAGEFRFRLKASNGENIGSSEGYTAKSGAKNGIESVKKNSVNDNHYEVFEGNNGKHYFRLKAGNGEVILASQGYSSVSGAKEGSQAVKRAAPDAETVELD
jgi:uncharacterized protein YegP (UPF0339 family)